MCLRNLVFSFVLFFGLTIFTESRAISIVDTGPGNASGNLFTNLRVDAGVRIAGMFTADKTYIIDSIEGWFGSDGFIFSSDAGDLTFSIYNEIGGFPGTIVNTITVNTPNLITSQWFGPSSLDWYVTPGVYWIAFEVPDDSTFSAITVQNVPSPLDKYSNYYDSQWGTDFGEFSFAARIQGSSFQVPVVIPFLPSAALHLSFIWILFVASRAIT
ncbi:MAG: hypothetical protein AAF387_19330 [Pseudomonadota bacterium]